MVAPEREHNTYVKYESKVRLCLLPHLGKKPLVKLTPAQIRAFMATLTREKVGASARFEVLRLRGRPLHPGQAGAARQGRRPGPQGPQDGVLTGRAPASRVLCPSPG
ncbi:tyrosine-type recombinase/integrase [Streptomyces tendae]|uniref:hypothetical protein n=1 Tax=Streptomyces tendae TaxID=1932 RepID=UPI0036BE68B6